MPRRRRIHSVSLRSARADAARGGVKERRGWGGTTMNSDLAVANRVPERSPSTAWQIVEGELILLRVKDNELLGLNHVARRIWEMVDGTQTVAQIAAAVTAEFDVPTESVTADSCRFIEELAAIGSITFRATA